MIAVTARTSGQDDARAATDAASASVPRTLGRREARRQHVARSTRGQLLSTAAQVPRRRVAAIAAAIVILVAFGLLVPLPSAVQLRDWATSVGPWFPLAFFAAHVVVTVFPFPRTAFTLAAGLLFGPLLGVSLAVVASTVSAVVALLLVRAAGWQLDRLVRPPEGRLVERPARASAAGRRCCRCG